MLHADIIPPKFVLEASPATTNTLHETKAHGAVGPEWVAKIARTIMIAPVDHLPRIFQANLHRFYTRVVTTAIVSLEPAERWELGTPESLDADLDRARAQVNANTRNEAAKAFVLVMSALFER